MPLCNIVILFGLRDFSVMFSRLADFLSFFFCVFFSPSLFAGCASRFSTPAFRQSIVSVSCLFATSILNVVFSPL
jgi:hypothetical protein